MVGYRCWRQLGGAPCRWARNDSANDARTIAAIQPNMHGNFRLGERPFTQITRVLVINHGTAPTSDI